MIVKLSYHPGEHPLDMEPGMILAKGLSHPHLIPTIQRVNLIKLEVRKLGVLELLEKLILKCI